METTEHRSCAYGLRHQTRCLSAIKSNDGKSRFIIGTQELLKTNEIHLLTFDEDMFEISSTIFSHPHEVWDISASKEDPDLFFTCYKQVIDGKKTQSRASLWRMKQEHRDSEETDIDRPHHHQPQGELEHVLTLDGDGTVKKVIWQDSTEVISVEDWRICIWDIDVKLGTAKVRRDSQPALILCVDYNPNRPFQIATGGDDCKVRIWDIRDSTAEPIMTIQDHTHWVWSVAYNKFHDQLVLTSSSDCQVNLQSIVSISTGADYNYGDASDAEQESPDEDDPTENIHQDAPTDGLVQAFDQHEDSVYQVAWSSVDPWLFMSLSYDGRAVMNQVPSEEKFKIILN
ncbi:Protein tssc1 [Entomortierella lignicola]|nr:Protein tssc1 [Entomortierella lignicola]